MKYFLKQIKNDMRTIEFRAWDNKNKKMFDSDWKGEAYGTGEIFLSQDGKVFELSSNYACEADGDGQNTDKLEAREWVVMQFTGLLDRHKKKIFEGDICKCISPEGHQDQDGILMVAWADHSDAWQMMTKPDYAGLHPGWFASLEVIGDIYTNPDLLKCN